MPQPWTTILAILALGVVYVLIPRVTDVFSRFRTAKRLRCPETEKEAVVSFDARQAAYTSAWGHPVLRVQDCSLWPERKGCGQSCGKLPERAMQEKFDRSSFDKAIDSF